MSDDEYQEAAAIEPPILIDKSILNTSRNLPNTPNKSPKVAYSVNNTTFYNEVNSSEEFVQFELYAEKLTNLANRKLFVANDVEEAETQFVYCSTPEMSEHGELNYDQELKLTIQTLPHGIVINSNVYLTHEQWNTIVFIDLVLVKCVVCEIFSDVESSDIHIQGEAHKKELSKYKPLARFDLSITRKIRDKYHCAVCNEAFSVDADMEHYYSKSHEGNLLSAINKVSDLNLDCVINDDGKNTHNNRNKNNDCYHFNRGNVNNDRNKINDSYHFNAAAIYRRDSSASESYDDDFEYDCNVNYDNEDDFFWETEQNSQPGNSYATMLKKPKLIEMPLFLEKDLGNKKVKVKFDSWHMLISPKVNRFYCMVCKEFNHIRCKSEHCAESSHIEKLEKCEIITRFGDYLIRGVDDKYYHCGHCNNLVIINDVEEHIEKNHSKFNKNAGDSAKNATKNNDNDKNSVNENGHVENGAVGNSINDTQKHHDLNGIPLNDNKENNINAMNNNDNNLISINKILNDSIMLTPFGYKMNVPLLSFHVLCKRPHDYYCGLCNLLCTEEMVVQHIFGLQHIQLLQRTPFILPFNCNLIRAIREALHCAICNLPVAASVIYIHIREPQHIQLLNKALNIYAPGGAPINNPNAQVPITQDSAILAVKTNQETTPVPAQNNSPKGKIETTKEVKRTPEKTKEKPKVTEKIETTKEKPKVVAAKIEATKEKLKKDEELTEEEESTTNEVDLNVSFESDINLDDYVYVKLKNTYFKINVTSYNTLVHLGDSKRYCFVCSLKVDEEELKKHVESRSHLENMDECKFLDRDGRDGLLRQIFLMYHCSTCNVLISRKELKNHLIWPTHTEEISTIQNITKKMRKNELKAGTNMYVASTQKEVIYLNEKETEIKLLFKVKIMEKKDMVLEKKMKIVIVDGDVLKINFENWNGVVKVKSGIKCQLCQIEFCNEELPSHVSSDGHVGFLNGSTFHKEYLSDLMRQVNDATLHCMVCNTEVSNKDFIVLEHTDGKKHKKNYENIRSMSSTTSAYTDCEGEVLQL